MEVYKLEESEKEVTVSVGVDLRKKAGMQQRWQVQKLELPRVLILEKESSGAL